MNYIKKKQQSKRGLTFAPCSNSTLTEAKVAALFKVNKVDEAIKVIEENMVN